MPEDETEGLMDSIRKAQDTISGLRGSLQQTQAERDGIKKEAERIAEENKALRAQMESMSGKIQEISEVIPLLAEQAKRAQRLEVLSKHPDILTMDPLKDLLLEAELPADKLDTYAQKLSDAFNEMIIGSDDEQETDDQPEPEATKEGETEPEATGEPEEETEDEPKSEEPQIPPGPPAMNISMLGGEGPSIQQALMEAVKSGDVDAVQKLTAEYLMEDVPNPFALEADQ